MYKIVYNGFLLEYHLGTPNGHKTYEYTKEYSVDVNKPN